MAEFHKKSRFDGKRPARAGAPFTRDRGGFAPRSGGFERKEMYDAECNTCHKVCQVPFRPNGKKPVYCRDCFQPSDDRRDARPSRDRFDAPARPAAADHRLDDVLRQLAVMNERLDALSAHVKSLAHTAELGAEVRRLSPPAATKKATVKVARKTAKKK